MTHNNDKTPRVTAHRVKCSNCRGDGCDRCKFTGRVLKVKAVTNAPR